MAVTSDGSFQLSRPVTGAEAIAAVADYNADRTTIRVVLPPSAARL